MPKFTLGELKKILRDYEQASSTEKSSEIYLAANEFVDIIEEPDDYVLYDGNPDNTDQKEMIYLYQFVFMAIEEALEKGHNIFKGQSPEDKLVITLSKMLDMTLPYHPPASLTKDMAHFQENMQPNKENKVLYRGDTREPEDVFGINQNKIHSPGFIPRASGGEVLDSPVVSSEENFICCSKKFRTAAGFPNDIEKYPESWVYVVVPESIYDVHKHAKTFLPAMLRSNEMKYNYIQNRLHGYEAITDKVENSRIVAAIKVSREPTHNLLLESPKFILGDIVINPNCTLDETLQKTIISDLTELKVQNEKVWNKLMEHPDATLLDAESKAIHTTSIQEAYKNPQDKNPKCHRRRRSFIGTMFEHHPEKEIEEKTQQAKKAEEETDEEIIQKLYDIVKNRSRFQ
ncbi:hypothetical protein [Aquicella lusitana]|uniref:Uncharacterized protein n=1 Tax=Aquicella lusitana TaxID=254246 RepID=A0A370GTA2_9COXI|nr:hypothetical protein [Aquicella lusitana]RDI45153.1 hypothetical protein C8D86_10729 [Aquicella lusitana]VVC72777.1 hypothetical protein AQULUS_05010 [Aquicella lusitana]